MCLSKGTVSEQRYCVSAKLLLFLLAALLLCLLRFLGFLGHVALRYPKVGSMQVDLDMHGYRVHHNCKIDTARFEDGKRRSHRGALRVREPLLRCVDAIPATDGEGAAARGTENRDPCDGTALQGGVCGQRSTTPRIRNGTSQLLLKGGKRAFGKDETVNDGGADDAERDFLDRLLKDVPDAHRCNFPGQEAIAALAQDANSVRRT